MNRRGYSPEETVEFEQLLNGKLGVAQSELRFLQESLKKRNKTEQNEQGKLFEAVSADTEQENIGQLLGRQQRFVKQLEAALVRIKNETYGVCQVTGELIEKDRLRLVPHTTQSVAAKNRRG